MLRQCTSNSSTINLHVPHYTLHTCPRRTTSTIRTRTCYGSMRDFISSECPLPGLDGAYREQPRVATLQAPFLDVPQEELPCPGQRRLLTVREQQLQAIIDQQGKVRSCSGSARPFRYQLIG
jgi:hypothetical protein